MSTSRCQPLQHGETKAPKILVFFTCLSLLINSIIHSLCLQLLYYTIITSNSARYAPCTSVAVFFSSYCFIGPTGLFVCL
jgi:hypothetical protein